jgi:protein BUR2
MASIDRYRPPREGYQPPSLPPTAARQERPSRSPVRRRDIPPPAPSPPTHTSRTSPPRPASRHAILSPRPIAMDEPAVESRDDQWIFTLAEARSSPSIVDGISPAEERLRRAKGVNFIYQAGVLLDLPQITLWVAGVFFHRFYMRYSMLEEKGGIHHYVSSFPMPLYLLVRTFNHGVLSLTSVSLSLLSTSPGRGTERRSRSVAIQD